MDPIDKKYLRNSLIAASLVALLTATNSSVLDKVLGPKSSIKENIPRWRIQLYTRSVSGTVSYNHKHYNMSAGLFTDDKPGIIISESFGMKGYRIVYYNKIGK